MHSRGREETVEDNANTASNRRTHHEPWDCHEAATVADRFITSDSVAARSCLATSNQTRMRRYMRLDVEVCHLSLQASQRTIQYTLIG